MSDAHDMFVLIQGHYSHSAHCEHQVEIAMDTRGIRSVEGKIRLVVEHIRKLVEHHPRYSAFRLDYIEWFKLGELFWTTYSPLIRQGRADDAAEQAKIHTANDNATHFSRGEISPQVQEVLNACRIEDCIVYPPGREERVIPPAVYAATKKVMEGYGGKWNTSKKGFVFASDPTDKLQTVKAGGKAVNEQQRDQAFYTPSDLARQLVEAAAIRSGHRVLEPSCGEGAILEWLENRKIDLVAVERNQETCRKVSERFPLADIRCADFTTIDPNAIAKFDRVVMNPPFTRNQDIRHTRHALRFLEPGGRLVAIVGANTDRKEWREFCDEWKPGKIQPIQAGAFKSSGTSIATLMITIDKLKP